jgi:hypothetical protein
VAALLGCPEPSEDQPVTCSENAMATASPMRYVTRNAPPIHLGYGTLNTLVPPNTNGLEMARGYAQLGKSGNAPLDEVETKDTPSTSTT